MTKVKNLIPEKKVSEHSVEQLQKAIQADKEKREKAFIAALEELCKEFNCAVGAKPFINEEGKIMAQPMIFAK